MSATRQQLNREKAARYLQKHPGERLRVERIARAAELTYQQASIALCALLNDGLLPGLTRPARGTYQWDPPAEAASPESREAERRTYRYRGTDRNGHGRFGTWAGTKASLAAKVEQWYRQGWRELTVVTGDGPVPPREDEELQVAGIGRRPGERRRTCWYETPGPVGRCSGTRELGKGGGDER
jgi:alkanesulfonate monooxygenase SsuD/methylene tetrahydromethanopterin reductase-like flavin-dependent oxidoreductase (luciferase family)